MLNSVRRVLKKYRENRRINNLKDFIVNAKHDVAKFEKSNVFDARKYGFSNSESMIYALNENNFKDYISTWESYQPRLIENKYFVISDDKFIFPLVFGNVTNVPDTYAIVLDGIVKSFGDFDLTNENLYDFLVNNNGGVLKDRGGCDGFDIMVFSTKDNILYSKDVAIQKDEFESIIAGVKNSIIQKRIVQCDFENQIFEKSINTIRVVTMKKADENKHEIVAALHRFGTNRSAPVDNFNQGGGSAIIDLETGKMSSMTCIDSFDSNGNRIFYDKHPDTNAQIKGVIVPEWNKIKSTIIDITQKLPLFDYIAWDVSLTNEGIAIIETNMKSSLNVFQVHGGLRNSFLGDKYREHGYIKE